jgi:hypothetical protein
MTNNNDLLYTNQFRSTENLTEDQIKKRVVNSNMYLKNLNKMNNSTEKYMKTNILTNDPLPINKALNNQFPANKNKNSYPILSDVFQDTSQDKYYKIKKTSLSINSDDRQFSESIMPNNYAVNLSGNYTNIQKIILKDISISNTLQTINTNNNGFYWEYPTIETLRNTGSDNQLIPSKFNDIFYTDVAEGKVNTEDSSQMIYGYKFPISFLDVSQMGPYIKKYINSNVFHGKKGIYDSDEIELEDPYKNTTNKILPYSNLTRKNIEYPYKSNNTLNTNMLFNVDIDIETHIVSIINRIEEVGILSVQTFYNEILSKNDNIYGRFIPISNTDTLLPNKIYITVFNESNLGNLNNNDPYPLVITELNNIGGIDSPNINNTCFFNEIIYINAYGGVPDYISTYKIFDRIRIPSGTTTVDLLRIELTLSTGNAGLYFNSSGYIITTSKTDSIIFNSSLQNLINGTTTIGGIYFTLQENQELTENNYPIIGRTLPFRFNNNVSNNCNKYNQTILNLLSFKTNEISDYIETISFSQNFKFIHRNIDQIYSSVFSSTNQEEIITEMLKINYPQYRLNIENYNNNYYFRSQPFIFIKIFPELNNKTMNNSLIRVTNTQNKNILSTYQKEFYFNLDNSFNSGNIYRKYTNNLFAKVYLDPIPYKTKIDISGRYEYKFEENPLENIDKIIVQITDPFGEILDLYLPHSFTLDIYEKISVLKDTLIDSRRGDIVTNGIASIYN